MIYVVCDGDEQPFVCADAPFCRALTCSVGHVGGRMHRSDICQISKILSTREPRTSAAPLLWLSVALLIIHREFYVVSYCVIVDPFISIVTNSPRGATAPRALWV